MSKKLIKNLRCDMSNFEEDMITFKKDFDELKTRMKKYNEEFNLVVYKFINEKYDNLTFDAFCDIIIKSNCLSIYFDRYRDIEGEGELFYFKCRLYDLYKEYGINTNEISMRHKNSLLLSSFKSLCCCINKLKEEELQQSK